MPHTYFENEKLSDLDDFTFSKLSERRIFSVVTYSLGFDQSPLSLPAISRLPLKLPRVVIKYPDILNDPLQTFHKSQMRRVLLKIIPPILFTGKM
jgi:hypothetical protein